MSANEARYAIARAEFQNGGLSLLWGDGHQSYDV